MAIAFKNAQGILTASLADLYTPSGLTAIIFGGQFANIGSVTYYLTIEIEDNSAGTFRDLVTALPIAPGDAYVLDTKITLEASDSFRAVADVTSVIEYNLSILEDPFNAV